MSASSEAASLPEVSSNLSDTPPPSSARSRKHGKTPSKRKNKKLTINLSCCKYDIVKKCSIAHGLRVVDESEPWNLFWIDTGVSVERVLAMEPYQKINHFPGMQEICRKDYLARNLNRLSRALPHEYNFFPKTYVLPNDWNELKLALKSARGKKASLKPTYIAKPDHGCQGKGIFLFRSLKAILPFKDSRGLIVQRYLNKPCLVDGYKFDLRVYVLVTSMEPLRIFIHRDGLARFATERYVDPSESNLDDVCMHLTNYAINKHSSNFDHTEAQDKGSKRTLESVLQLVVSQQQPPGRVSVEMLRGRIHEVIVKTIATIQPQVRMSLHALQLRRRTTRVSCPSFCSPLGASASAPVSAPVSASVSGSVSGSFSGGVSGSVSGGVSGGGGSNNPGSSACFEILGFDVFLDRRLRAWVLEANHSPSFSCDSHLDSLVKSAVISDALSLINLRAAARFHRHERIRARGRLLANTSTNASSSLSASNNTTSSCSLEAITAFEDAHMGNYERVYPSKDPQRMAVYQACLESAAQTNLDTAATKGRIRQLQRHKQEMQEKINKLEKWRSGLQRGMVKDENGCLKKVVSKVMEWRWRERKLEWKDDDPEVPDEYSFQLNDEGRESPAPSPDLFWEGTTLSQVPAVRSLDTLKAALPLSSVPQPPFAKLRKPDSLKQVHANAAKQLKAVNSFAATAKQKTLVQTLEFQNLSKVDITPPTAFQGIVGKEIFKARNSLHSACVRGKALGKTK